MIQTLEFSVRGSTKDDIKQKVIEQVAQYTGMNRMELAQRFDSNNIPYKINVHDSSTVMSDDGYERVVEWEADVEIKVDV